MACYEGFLQPEEWLTLTWASAGQRNSAFVLSVAVVVIAVMSACSVGRPTHTLYCKMLSQLGLLWRQGGWQVLRSVVAAVGMSLPAWLAFTIYPCVGGSGGRDG
jgi:hypothetical protein